MNLIHCNLLLLLVKCSPCRFIFLIYLENLEKKYKTQIQIQSLVQSDLKTGSNLLKFRYE